MSTTASASSARQPGRPSGFTPEIITQLVSVIERLGCSDTAAAKRCGIPSSTLSRWKEEYPDLAAGLRMAREEFRAAKLAIIIEAASAEGGKGWRAAAWMLERTFPEDYHPKAAERRAFQEMACRDEAVPLRSQAEAQEAQACHAEAVPPRRREPDAEPTPPQNTPDPSHNSRNHFCDAEVPRRSSSSAKAGPTLPAGCDPAELPSLDFLPVKPSHNSRNSPAKPAPMTGSIAAMLPTY